MLIGARRCFTASEVTTLWRDRNVCIIIIIIIISVCCEVNVGLVQGCVGDNI